MSKDKLQNDIEKLKQHILEEPSLEGKTEEALLTEISRLQAQILEVHMDRSHPYTKVMHGIGNLVREAGNAHNDGIQLSISNLRNAVKHLEDDYPQLVSTVEKICNLFNGWGLV